MLSKLVGPGRPIVISVLMFLLVIGPLVSSRPVGAQSGRQTDKKKVEKKTDVQKGADNANPQEPAPPTGQEGKDEPRIKLSTQVVNVDVTVIDKKTHRLITNLGKQNFAIYEDGIKQEITNIAPGDGPATVVLLLDNGFQNHFWVNYWTPSTAQEIFQSAGAFIQSFVKPHDYVSLVTFSMKPKVIQDFTNDRQLLYQALMSAYRDLLNFRESNIFDALSFVLLGGKAIQLYEENAGPSEYIGVEEIEGHTAVILITTGIDTFSRITYDKALKIVSQAGVPIFTIGVGNLFFKKYGDRMSGPDRLTFLQAQNELKTFASRTGGDYFEMTFEGEIPSIMKTIEAELRTQYSLGYVPTNTRREGKERKIKLEVDMDGDGKPDNEKLELHYRDRYIEPGGPPPKAKK
jgi:VWFA-related protein